MTMIENTLYTYSKPRVSNTRNCGLKLAKGSSELRKEDQL
jgi:hypothetical protein